MRTFEGTWFYVSLDAPSTMPTALRFVGNVQTPGGLGLLAETINKRLFNASRLLLLPSHVRSEPSSDSVESIVPVRTFDGSHLQPGQTVTAAALRVAHVLDIAGITPSRLVAESWARS